MTGHRRPPGRVWGGATRGLVLQSRGRAGKDSIRWAIRTVGDAPERWRAFDEHGARRYLVGQFPYGIIYEIEGSTVTVLAVAHLRRRPAYWRK